MKTFEVKNHAPSYLPDGEWKIVWADEFDGEALDASKWDYRLSMMGKRHEAWTDKGVHLDGNSNAVFEIFEENGHIVSSQLQTGYNFMDEPVTSTKFGKDELQWPIGKLRENIFMHRYGYYECRARLQQKNGWWSAFWLQSPIIGCCLDPAKAGIEVDIMECFTPPEIAKHNLFWGGYGLDSKRLRCGGKSGLDKTQYHYFGVDWSESGYIFYVDGEETGRLDAPVSQTEQFILISTEVKGYRSGSKCQTKEAYESVGDIFLVDHVRVFDRCL